MLYAITAHICRNADDGGEARWYHTKQIPTFYLDSNVQGIVDTKHAERIATDILNPFGDKSLGVSVYAVPVK